MNCLQAQEIVSRNVHSENVDNYTKLMEKNSILISVLCMISLDFKKKSLLLPFTKGPPRLITNTHSDDVEIQMESISGQELWPS